jgi:hypothetical protein
MHSKVDSANREFFVARSIVGKRITYVNVSVDASILVKIEIRILQDTSSRIESIINQYDQLAVGFGCRRNVYPKWIITLMTSLTAISKIYYYSASIMYILGECSASSCLSTKTWPQNETEPK